MILHIVVLSTVLSFGLSVDSGSLLLALAKAQQHVRELSTIVANIRESAIPRDCSDLQRAGQNTSGVYTIFVSGGTTGRPVYCDMDTGRRRLDTPSQAPAPELDYSTLNSYGDADAVGEPPTVLVIQNRGQFGNKVFYFYRNWTEYARGFGEPGKEYWIGNNALHALTSEGRNQTLRIELRNGTGETFVAHYSAFKVASESNFYKLNVSGYSGPAGSDSFSYANGANFSTFDQDHDSYGDNCAEKFRGGWWYTSCHHSNLNGLNLNGQHPSYADGIDWSQLYEVTGRHHYSYPEVQMKIRKGGMVS
ncbi:hypothetical protein HPB47_022044 [Ixodes persulcatus]|uniref:Uncharacterized protein n=1 Tax=Ixodes persulcatus TaxID=34615 RepID=A0AC60QAW0_IXOPE|nr:hypothetical protein HPB47_022044 [Ixodes persulcatus]